METCLCQSIHQLAKQYDESRAESVISALNDHLRDIRSILSQSKSLTRDVRYRITLSNQRTSKALDMDSIDIAPVDRVCAEFDQDIDGFWTAAHHLVHPDLRRRVATVVTFLQSKLDPELPLPPLVARAFQGQQNYAEIRNSGRKYIRIARKLSSLGAILWLPLSIPPSTYERYLNIDDEEVFTHLQSLTPKAQPYTDFVQRLVMRQLRGPSYSYCNLFADNSDFIPASDQLALLLDALGGSDIPDTLLRSVRLVQRRWNADGEIESTIAVDFGFPDELVHLLSDEGTLEQIMRSSPISKHVLDDGIVTWSLSAEMRSHLSQAILPPTREKLGAMALKLICFACPPCYEGNVSWSASMKRAIWPICQRALKTYKVQSTLRIQMLEAVLYFCERDFVDIRQLAAEEAKTLLRKSMPYYLHASVALFRSVLHRLDGDFIKSEATIRDFLFRGPRPETRRDHALLGRLHISQIDNKIRCYDNDVSSFIYKWAADQPLSSLDIEVTSRLQSAAARYLQSVGDFGVARASLEQLLALNTAKPLRANSRRLLVCRLADVYCEMGEHEKALDILQPEFDSITSFDRRRRLFWRLLLALAEANIGIDRLDTADSVLGELRDVIPLEVHDLYDEQLHMRMVLAAARTAQTRPGNQVEALFRWRFALQEVERMHTLKAKGGFTAAMVYLSLAHAQLATGDKDGARHSWAAGTEILRSEICEFSIPIVPTVWLHRVATEVQELQGWSCRIMLPGGRPDITWSS